MCDSMFVCVEGRIADADSFEHYACNMPSHTTFPVLTADVQIRDAIIWTPTSAEDVDLRYRGVCDPSDPRALFWNSTIYLYNITNLDAMRQGAKPSLVGPR